jgi:hypothetical protein
MIRDYQVGAFRGRKTIQSKGEIGGARSVFVKLQGNKNELVYPTFGGFIKNPFKGAAKMFAGDLMWYKTDDKGAKPEIYILKTYLVESVEGNVVNIVRDGFKHKPFVGDFIGVAPEEIGREMTATSITSVIATKVGEQDVWACTMNRAIEASKGDVLVEADEDDGSMLVKDINAVADADMDMLDAPAEGDEDFEGARYSYTPALGGIMYIYKMSPIPACVRRLNQARVNGWFQIQSV